MKFFAIIVYDHQNENHDMLLTITLFWTKVK